MPLTVYVVSQQQGSLGPENQPVAFFTDRAVADRYKEQCDALAIAKDWSYRGFTYTHDVEEVTVDDPEQLKWLEGGTE